MSAPDAPTFTILLVCSGNICRSPIAQQLLRSRLEDAPTRFEVLSAGTIAQPGLAMTDEAAEMSRHYGGRPDEHLSTPLTAELVHHAQLVLTATREHRAAVVSLHPRASRYTFTLNQIARLLASLEPADLAPIENVDALIATIAGQRGIAPPPDSAESDDIADPYRRPIEVYERAAAQIDRAVAPLAEALRAVRPVAGMRPVAGIQPPDGVQPPDSAGGPS